jgi:hypothetical protein
MRDFVMKAFIVSVTGALMTLILAAAAARCRKLLNPRTIAQLCFGGYHDETI